MGRQPTAAAGAGAGEDLSDDDLREHDLSDDGRADDGLVAGERAVAPRGLPWLLLVGGLVGLLASFDLLVERIQLLIDPEFVPSCNINPLLSCGSVMVTEQARLLGFPNPVLGVAGFAVVATTGAALLAGARLRPWYWWGLLAGELLGVVFVHWLAYQSVFSIGALCPWCMVVWTVTLPVFLWTVVHAASAGHLGLGAGARRAARAVGDYAVAVLVGWYGLFVVVIALAFWDQWATMLGI
ncbi:vitamin K epoxide reductase family protein [Thalassiella azotivora]